MTAGAGSAREGSRVLRVAAVAGLALEAALLLVAAGAYAVHATTLDEPLFAVGLAAFFGLSGAGLIPVARATARAARWAVSAAVTWQAIQLLAGLSLVGVRPWLGVPAAALALAVGVAVIGAGRDSIRGDA